MADIQKIRSLAQQILAECGNEETWPIISGLVYNDDDGGGLDGVTLEFTNYESDGSSGYAGTKDGGFFNYSVPYGWTGRIIPRKDGWTFPDDPFKSYENVTDHLAGQNFLAKKAEAPVLKRLEVEKHYFKIGGKRTFLAGLSIGARLRKDYLSRIQQLGGHANYVRIWLESWDDPTVYSPTEPGYFEFLGEVLNALYDAGIVTELCLFNNWAKRTFPNDYHGMIDSNWKRWIKDVLTIVDHSKAKDFVIIECDNERMTGERHNRNKVIHEIRKYKPNSIISTIMDYSEDYNVITGDNDVITFHKGGTADPHYWTREIEDLHKKKPVIPNELYIGAKKPRFKQQLVLKAIYEAAGAGFCVDWWGGYNVSLEDTIKDVSKYMGKEPL